MCPCGPNALVNTSVFCADLRLEFAGKTEAGLSAASSEQWDMRPTELHFNRTKGLMEIGTMGLLGFLVYDRRLTETCITDGDKSLSLPSSPVYTGIVTGVVFFPSLPHRYSDRCYFPPSFSIKTGVATGVVFFPSLPHRYSDRCYFPPSFSINTGIVTGVVFFPSLVTGVSLLPLNSGVVTGVTSSLLPYQCSYSDRWCFFPSCVDTTVEMIGDFCHFTFNTGISFYFLPPFILR